MLVSGLLLLVFLLCVRSESCSHRQNYTDEQGQTQDCVHCCNNQAYHCLQTCGHFCDNWWRYHCEDKEKADPGDEKPPEKSAESDDVNSQPALKSGPGDVKGLQPVEKSDHIRSWPKVSTVTSTPAVSVSPTNQSFATTVILATVIVLLLLFLVVIVFLSILYFCKRTRQRPLHTVQGCRKRGISESSDALVSLPDPNNDNNLRQIHASQVSLQNENRVNRTGDTVHSNLNRGQKYKTSHSKKLFPNVTVDEHHSESVRSTVLQPDNNRTDNGAQNLAMDVSGVGTRQNSEVTSASDRVVPLLSGLGKISRMVLSSNNNGVSEMYTQTHPQNGAISRSGSLFATDRHSVSDPLHQCQADARKTYVPKMSPQNTNNGPGRLQPSYTQSGVPPESGEPRFQLDVFSNVHIEKEVPDTALSDPVDSQQPASVALHSQNHCVADRVIALGDSPQSEGQGLHCTVLSPNDHGFTPQTVEGYQHPSLCSELVRNKSTHGCSERETSQPLLADNQEFVAGGQERDRANPRHCSDRETGAASAADEQILPGIVMRQSNRWIYDQLKQIDWVMGYYSAGESIEVYVNLDSLDPHVVEQQLADITGADIHKFHVKQSEEP